jgi:hypothetical protein
MAIDDIDKVIFKKIESSKDIPLTKEMQTVLVGSNGKVQVLDKVPRNINQEGTKYFSLSTAKRWYRIPWGTRSPSSAIKAHGEMSVAMVNPMRFLFKLQSEDLYTVRELQILLSEQITAKVQDITGKKFLVEDIKKKLNDNLELYGLEISVMDVYKGAQ